MVGLGSGVTEVGVAGKFAVATHSVIKILPSSLIAIECSDFAFQWTFTDYGPGYTSFSDGHLAGGFTTDEPFTTGGALVVLHNQDP